jgi:hypothetical protein
MLEHPPKSLVTGLDPENPVSTLLLSSLDSTDRHVVPPFRQLLVNADAAAGPSGGRRFFPLRRARRSDPRAAVERALSPQAHADSNIDAPSGGVEGSLDDSETRRAGTRYTSFSDSLNHAVSSNDMTLSVGLVDVNPRFKEEHPVLIPEFAGCRHAGRGCRWSEARHGTARPCAASARHGTALCGQRTDGRPACANDPCGLFRAVAVHVEQNEGGALAGRQAEQEPADVFSELDLAERIARGLDAHQPPRGPACGARPHPDVHGLIPEFLGQPKRALHEGSEVKAIKRWFVDRPVQRVRGHADAFQTRTEASPIGRIAATPPTTSWSRRAQQSVALTPSSPAHRV